MVVTPAKQVQQQRNKTTKIQTLTISFKMCIISSLYTIMIEINYPRPHKPNQCVPYIINMVIRQILY